MRVLFTLGNGHFPQLFGGTQSSTHQLVGRLKAQGHDVAVACRLCWWGEGGGWRSRVTEYSSRVQRKMTGRRFSRDTSLGYPVYRAWDASDVSEVADRFRPDVAVVQQGHNTLNIARSLIARGIPVVFYFRNVEMGELDGDLSDLRIGTRHIANSAFTARRYHEALGITSTVIPPLVEASAYATETTRENVTFINPDPKKGGDLAMDLAALCPDIPFTFVESWTLSEETRAHIMARLAKLPNVTLHPRTRDMKAIYGKARVLLAPSQWEEAWGRVASEAHCSGIPVLGSNRGGLPEAIGPGGVILPHDAPAADWAAALRRMWDDPAEYKRLSDTARAFAQRPEMQPENQFATFIRVLEEAAASRSAAAA